MNLSHSVLDVNVSSLLKFLAFGFQDCLKYDLSKYVGPDMVAELYGCVWSSKETSAAGGLYSENDPLGRPLW